MKRPGEWLAKWGDKINPVTVKELRQVVEGKFAISILFFVLLLQLLVVGWVLVSAQQLTSAVAAGPWAFTSLHTINLVVCLCLIPAYTAMRLSGERTGSDVDLMYVTPLSPGSIIRGKLIAALAMTLLILSASAPFMAVTFFMRGIDLATILILTAISFLFVAAGVLLAIFVGCLPVAKVAKILIGVVFVVILFWFLLLLSLSLGQLLTVGWAGQLSSWGFWRVGLPVLLVFGLALGMLYVLCVALITPRTANRALPVRLAFTAIWLVSAIVFTIWGLDTGTANALAFWGGMWTVVFCLALFVSVSEREQIGPRLRQAIPRRPGARWLAFFFYSGAGGGLGWAFSILAATALYLAASPSLFGWPQDRPYVWAKAVWGAGLCCLAYALFAVLLRRKLLKSLQPRHTGLAALVLTLLGSLLPMLAGAILTFESWQTPEGFRAWLVGNPFAMGIEDHQNYYLTAALLMVAAALAANRSWLLERAAVFTRLDPRFRQGIPARQGVAERPPAASPQPSSEQ